MSTRPGATLIARYRTLLLAALGVAVPAALVAIGWADYASARREFSELVRAQGASVRDTIAAAARSNAAAADEAEAQLVERLLDNARLLAELDRRDALSSRLLDRITAQNHLFRVTVLSADGSREAFAGGPDTAAEHGFGRGRGRGAGAGTGGGPDSAALIERLVRGAEREAVTPLHAGRRTGAARLAAGVRRDNGGAIVISVGATDVLNLRQQSALDRLLDDIVRNTSDVAYLVFEQGDVRRARGDLPVDFFRDAPGHPVGATLERAGQVDGRPVLEITGPIALNGTQQAHVHLGMRLDGLRRAERRTALRLVTSLTAAMGLGGLALGLVWLHRQYGTLSLEHARIQEALRRRDRLAAMGELASTVAHEIRNPLNAIAMSAQRLKRECLSDPDTAAATDRDDALALVGVIQGEAQRINHKVQQFLEFARPPVLRPHPTALDPWTRAIADSLAPLAAARGVTLAREPMNEADVVIDPEQMRQAVDNLVRNAVEATPSGGTVTLAARVTAREAILEVRDNGQGIAPEHLPKIFDLYFTTKAEGTGVGLAVSQQVVVAHGGRLDVNSIPGRGTTMRIVLPRHTAATHA